MRRAPEPRPAEPCRAAGPEAPSSAPLARFKICGLTTPEAVEAAACAGAACAGFVLYPPSPRHLTIEAARALMARVPEGVERVALVVDAGDAMIDAILGALPVDLLQLHGSETPERAAALSRRVPVMKAVGVRGRADLAGIAAFEAVCARVLVDAKPALGALPGGNGLAFDWRLLEGRRWARPWMLAGGLTPGTAALAARATQAPCLDVSSGVERAPGIKDPGLVAAFGRALQHPAPGGVPGAAAGARALT